MSDLLQMLEDDHVRTPLVVDGGKGVVVYEGKVVMASGHTLKEFADSGIRDNRGEFNAIMDTYASDDKLNFSQYPKDIWVKWLDEILSVNDTNAGIVYKTLLASGNVVVSDTWSSIKIRQSKMNGPLLMPDGRLTKLSIDLEKEDVPLSISYDADESLNPLSLRTLKFSGRASDILAERFAVAKLALSIEKQRDNDLTKLNNSLFKGYVNASGTNVVATGAVGGGSWSADPVNAVNAVLGTKNLLKTYDVYGPHTLFVSSDLDDLLDRDMVTLNPTRTLRERLLAIPSISTIELNIHLNAGEFTLSSNSPLDWSYQSYGPVRILEVNNEYHSSLAGQNIVAFSLGTVLNNAKQAGYYNVVKVTGNS